ncbi:TadE/TadG family type IV pilus assembly protein [Uliginosibacterium sp. H1]|uniref:TadE/TadG family type IV pilus assembly protein n=1 Tax=Uliginosibacterium sp. H1 TaxID=3114757 RepID=UPI002E186916|nr:hypothetical protein [Uliginosibacterium sp. H1]
MSRARPRLRRHQAGALAPEAALVLPVVITAAMMAIELANIGLSIHRGRTALQQTVTQLREGGVLPRLAGVSDAQLELRLRQGMLAAADGKLRPAQIASLAIERFPVPGSVAAPAGPQWMPAWRVTVDVRQAFVTVLPRLVIGNGAFRYRHQQWLADPQGDADAAATQAPGSMKTT